MWRGHTHLTLQPALYLIWFLYVYYTWNIVIDVGWGRALLTNHRKSSLTCKCVIIKCTESGDMNNFITWALFRESFRWACDQGRVEIWSHLRVTILKCQQLQAPAVSPTAVSFTVCKQVFTKYIPCDLEDIFQRMWWFVHALNLWAYTWATDPKVGWGMIANRSINSMVNTMNDAVVATEKRLDISRDCIGLDPPAY